MLDDLAAFELENVHNGAAAPACRRHVVDVQDDIIAVGEDAFDLAVVVGEFVTQEGETLLALPARPLPRGLCCV
jgi:hypothetical protein